jgi:phage terminase large subunit GpA-like protein
MPVRLLTVVLLLAMTLDPITRLRQAGADAWRPPAERPVRSDWCCSHIRFPKEVGAQPGRFDLDTHAYLREPLDAVDDHEVREIVFIGGTQIGKTSYLHANLLSQEAVDRAPMMFAGPDKVFIREQRDVIYRLAEEIPELAGQLLPEHLRNDRTIDLEHCRIYLAWSGSTQRLSGRACKKVLCSEVDRWQHSPSLASERTKAFFGSTTTIFEGTPVGESPYMHDLYDASDRRTFRVPCPKCGHYQELRFFPHKGGPHAGRGGVGGLKDEKGNWRTPEEGRKAAHYICEKGCTFDSQEKNEAVRRGVWAPEGCQVTEDGKVTGAPKHPGRRRGYRVGSIYSETITLGDMAEKYLTVRDSEEGLRGFFNDWLGLRFEPRGNAPKWKELGIRLASHYPMGSVPKEAYFLTAGADVQSHGVFYVIRAWGDKKTSWLVEKGYLPKKTHGDEDDVQEVLASDLAQLEMLLARRWNVLGENPLGYSQLAVRLLAIDCGHRPTDVFNFVRAHPGGRVLAVFGDPRIVPGSLFRPARGDRNARTGKPYPDGVRPWGVETNAYKTEIAGRWMADRTQPGVWWLPENILDVEGGEDYLRQITAERREAAAKGRAEQWVLPSHDMPNHYWDGEVYAICAADMVVGCEWEAANWPWASRPAEPTPKSSEQIAARDLPPEDFSAR